MKKLYLWFGAIVVIAAIVLSVDMILDMKKPSTYCYDTKMGMKLHQGVPNKYCKCKGKEVTVSTCPTGTLCDSSTVHCQGEVAGHKYGYGSGKRQQEFDNLVEWENFCKTTKPNEKENCMRNLEHTKSKVQ
jgi:hypothetical protein